jgi:nucleoside-diphosphate-sugar epimerase
MHALVTGAAGFLGLYIVEQLVARGERVRAMCRRPTPELAALPVEIVSTDLRDRAAVIEACRGVDTVFHVAGVAGIWGPWKHFHETNTVGTQSALEGCRAHEVKRLIYTSSPSVTFDGGDQCGIAESAPYPERWLCHYPHSKAIAEREVLAANGFGGLATCSLRPHLIWGPRDRHLIPRLIARARSGRLRRVGDGQNMIDMVYVENAAEAHLQAADALNLDSPVAGSAYFISQGEPINCWQWVDELLALVDLPPIKRSVPFKLAWNIGAALEGIYGALHLPGEPPMTRFLAAQLGKHHWFDITRARQHFNFRPRISTADGMQRLGECLREQFRLT